MDDLYFNTKQLAFDVWVGAGKRLDHVAEHASDAVVFSHKEGEDSWKLACAPRAFAHDREKMLSLYRALQAHCQSKGWLQNQPPKPESRHPSKLKTDSVTVPIEALPELNAAIASQRPGAMEALKRKYPQPNGPANHS